MQIGGSGAPAPAHTRWILDIVIGSCGIVNPMFCNNFRIHREKERDVIVLSSDSERRVWGIVV